MSFFFFSLSHTLTVFLSISSHGLHLSKWLNISLCFALSGTILLSLELTHTGRIWLSVSALLTRPNALCFFFFFCFNTPQGRMASASFFSFSLACPTCFATLLNKRSQTMLFASPNFLSSFSMLDMFQSSLIKRHG